MIDVKANSPNRGFPRRMRFAAAVALLVVAGAAAVGVHAQSTGHGRGGAWMTLFGGSPEHVGRAVDRLLDGLNATDAQRTQINQIATAAAADLKAQRTGSPTLRAQAMQIFTAPTVDARAAEGLRQQVSAQRDQASKRELQALLDISQVLTPDQRTAIANRVQQHQAAWRDRMQSDRTDRSAQ